MARHDAHLNNLSHVCAEPNQALEHGTKRGPGLSRPSNWPNKKPKHASLNSASIESQPLCDQTELGHQRRPHPTADPVTQAVRTEAIRSHAAVGSIREGGKGDRTQHCCHTGVEGRVGPSRVEAAAMAPPRQAVQRGPCGPGGRCVAPLPHQPASITCPAPSPSPTEPNSNCSQPSSRHQEGAQPSADVGSTRLPPATCLAASPLSLPVKERELLKRAKALQQQLLYSPDTVPVVKNTLADESSTGILQGMSQPAQQVDWSTAGEEYTPMVCIPCDRGGGLQHLPPPLLFVKGDKWVWKPPSWPWHTVAQQWGKVAWTAYVEPCLVLGLQPIQGPEPTADNSIGKPQSHAAPNLLNRSPLQNGEVMGQEAPAAEAPFPMVALHALPVGSNSHSDQHACKGVHGSADQAGPGCRGGGHELNTVTPPQEPCAGPSCTASNSRGQQPAQPYVGLPANLTAVQPTVASSPSFTQATATSSSVEPDGRQEEGAPSYVAVQPAHPPVMPGAAVAQWQPGTVYGCLFKAWALQQQLLSGRLSRPASICPPTTFGSHRVLGLLATPAAKVDLHDRRDESMVPVICMPHDGKTASPQPPCPFLVSLHDKNHVEVLWKNPRIQWGRLLQGWQAVEWVGRAPGGQLVLGLRAAAGSGSAAPGPASLVAPETLAASTLPPPPCHHQGQVAQLANILGEGLAGGPETASAPPAAPAAPPAAPAAPPCGPEPLDGLQGGPDLALGPDAGPQAPGVEDVPWCQFAVNPRSLQVLIKEQIKIFGLEGSAVGTEATVRVVLVFPPNQPCNNDYGSLEVIYKAQRRSGGKGRWGLTIADGNRRTIRTWVEGKGLRLTGRYKAHRRSVVTGPHRLEIQVQPLPQAGIHTGQSTADANGSMNRAGPCQPNVEPAPAAGEGEAGSGGTVGTSSGLNRKSTGGGAGQAEGAAVAEPGAERQPPPVEASAPAEEEACRTDKGMADIDQGQSQRSGQGLDDGERMETDGGAAQVSGLSVPSLPEGHVDADNATAEERGPGPSPAAAGMGGATCEGDPVVPLPAAAPAHAGVFGSNGQGVIDIIDMTQEEPEVKPEHGEWHQLITSIVSFLHAHLPKAEHQNVAKAHLRMIEWRGRSDGGVHLHALATAHAATQKECAWQTAAHTAWVMWESVWRLMLSDDVTA
ncbi:hypothetical protein V8C86DRAFT_2679083 [Haematococcus lacustris]